MTKHISFHYVNKTNHSGRFSVCEVYHLADKNTLGFHSKTKTNEDLVSVCHSFRIWKDLLDMKILETNKHSKDIQVEPTVESFLILIDVVLCLG